MSVASNPIVYKESGIPWVGKIPKHWTLEKCKNFFTIRNAMVGDLWNQTRLLSLTLNGVIERDINNPEGKFPSDFSTYQLVKKNDLVFCLFDVEETPRAIGLATLEGMITGAYTVISVQKQDERFMAYFFINLDNYKRLSFLYRGLRKTISKEDLLNLKIPLPPLEEQKKIADFLDTKTRQIEEFIDKKQKLITLLEEKKQTLINQCVTQGLDKSTKLRDSGIPYLGKIPEHWEIRKIKHIASTNIGLVYSPNDIIDKSDNSLGILRSNNIREGKINYSNLIFIDSQKVKKKQIASIGDLLMCVRNGSEDLVGKTAKITKNDFAFGAFMAIVKSSYNDYLYWIFQTDLLRKSIANFSVSIGIGQISQEDIKNFISPFPPLEEQKAIAEYLDTQIEKIDCVISKIKSQINLIKEYKTTLISEAVCGRVEGI